MITQQQSQYTQDLIDGLQENGDPVSVEAAQELQNLQRFREAIQEVMGCFNAAEIEGLSKALQETDDLHLKDLVERRLMYAFYAAEQAASDCELDEDQQEAQVAQSPTPVWKPIETAPKGEGGLVDIMCNDRRYAGCHYDRICDEYRHITACGVLVHLKGATHWMPVPANPQSAQGEKK